MSNPIRGQYVRATALLFVILLLTIGAVTSASQDAQGTSAPTGTITGHVKLTARVRGTALPSNVYLPRAVNLPAKTAGPEIANVVVYLKDPAFRGEPATSRVKIEQIREAFVPRVVAITRGSIVDFPNGDPYFHNVFSLSRAAAFDLGRYPEGKSHAFTFTRSGLVKVFCHIHSHMSASILVLDHPYFVTPDANGNFVLRDVPAGSYAVAGWHERIGERTESVRVQAGRTASLELSLPVEDSQ